MFLLDCLDMKHNLFLKIVLKIIFQYTQKNAAGTTCV